MTVWDQLVAWELTPPGVDRNWNPPRPPARVHQATGLVPWDRRPSQCWGNLVRKLSHHAAAIQRPVLLTRWALPSWEDRQCCEFDIDSIFSYTSLIQRSVPVILCCIGGMIISTKGAVRRPMTYDDHQSNQTQSNPTRPLNELHKPQVERRTTSNELIWTKKN